MFGTSRDRGVVITNSALRFHRQLPYRIKYGPFVNRARPIPSIHACHSERSKGPHTSWLITQSNENPRTPSGRSFAVFAAQDDKKRACGSGSGLAGANYASCNPD